MPNAAGMFKQLRYKKESAWGTAPGASGAQILRRVTSNVGLKKQTFQSAEIRSDYQMNDFRHGVRSVEGSINGELSAGTWKDFFAAVCRQAFQTAPTTGALTNVTAAASNPQFVRAAGSFLTDGFKVGDIVRWSGWVVATANNTRNFLITALTATNMTGVFLDGTAVVARASGDSVTCVLTGKKTWAPTSGHTDDSFAFEHWFSDIAQSELFTGCKISRMALNLPPTGIATIQLDVMGQDITTATSQYYTSPTVETTTGALAAANGALYVAGTAIAVVTGLQMNLNANMTSDAVVGSNKYADIFEGRILVDGQFTAYFVDATARDYFVNETEISLNGVFTSANSATADFISVMLPRIKVGGADKDDGEKGIVQTFPFQALYNNAGGAGISSQNTTISIQDSQA